VRFVDGSEETIDVIVWSTGYKITFPFFDQDFISAPDNELFLYRRVFKPGVDNLFFIALLQPLGPTMPIAEAQGRWIAAYLRGEYALPSITQMKSEIGRERARMRRRYVASKRHTMEVDFDDYLYALRRELKAGAARARAAGSGLPVPARAQTVATAAGPGG
jgi:dimethylaniline monooxygenase (N-oxide forming)